MGTLYHTTSYTHCHTTSMRLSLIICCYLSLVISAPQGYGGGGGPPVRAPQVSQPSRGVVCRTEYAEIWDTQYVESETQECQTMSRKQCYPRQRQACETVVKQACQTLYRPKCVTRSRPLCVTKQRTEYYTETECGSQVKEDCEYHWEGQGSEKRWVPNPSTCRNNAYDSCRDVQKENYVPYEDCSQQENYEDCSQQEAYQDCRNV